MRTERKRRSEWAVRRAFTYLRHTGKPLPMSSAACTWVVNIGGRLGAPALTSVRFTMLPARWVGVSPAASSLQSTSASQRPPAHTDRKRLFTRTLVTLTAVNVGSEKPVDPDCTCSVGGAQQQRERATTEPRRLAALQNSSEHRAQSRREGRVLVHVVHSNVTQHERRHHLDVTASR
jgi:hypothetical protein